MKFFLGTTNKYKVRELAAILGPLGIEMEVTGSIDPDETEDTFDGNALLKASAYALHVGSQAVAACREHHSCSTADALSFLRLSQVWTISEDSGIAIPRLNGLPGPWSARFDDCELSADALSIVAHNDGGRDRDVIDLANNLRVLELLKGVEQPYRAAEFVVSLVVADIEGNALFQTTSRVAGWVAPEMLGTNGFGYDPLFISGSSFGKTWAQIDGMRKNLISHRRRALQELTVWIARQLKRGITQA
jgi:XTP/dITP diphosphohydrolase